MTRAGRAAPTARLRSVPRDGRPRRPRDRPRPGVRSHQDLPHRVSPPSTARHGTRGPGRGRPGRHHNIWGMPARERVWGSGTRHVRATPLGTAARLPRCHAWRPRPPEGWPTACGSEHARDLARRPDPPARHLAVRRASRRPCSGCRSRPTARWARSSRAATPATRSAGSSRPSGSRSRCGCSGSPMRRSAMTPEPGSGDLQGLPSPPGPGSCLSISAADRPPLFLLYFPDGRLPSRRWRPVLWAVGLGGVLLVVGTIGHSWVFDPIFPVPTGRGPGMPRHRAGLRRGPHRRDRHGVRGSARADPALPGSSAEQRQPRSHARRRDRRHGRHDRARAS